MPKLAGTVSEAIRGVPFDPLVIAATTVAPVVVEIFVAVVLWFVAIVFWFVAVVLWLVAVAFWFVGVVLEITVTLFPLEPDRPIVDPLAVELLSDAVPVPKPVSDTPESFVARPCL